MARKKAEEVPMKKVGTNRQLETENEALRIRLEEAEETLRAIRNHEVDALVVEGPQGQQVFTLQGAEQPYRTLMETMSEGALTVAADGTILYCNSRLSEMIETPLNKIIGESFHAFVFPRDGQSLEAMLDACGREGRRGDFLLKTAGGGVPVSLSCRQLKLDDVEAFCIVATDLTEQMRTREALEEARDRLEERVARRTAELTRVNAALREEITERKRLGEDLRIKQQELSTLVDHSADMIVRFDKHFRHVFVNDQAAKIAGLEKGQMLGKSNADLGMPEENVAQWHTFFKEVFDTKRTERSEFYFTGPSGKIYLSTIAVPEFDERGDVETLLCITRDITERKRAEEALQKAHDELELRVQERTKELQQACDNLIEETRERERAEALLRQAQKMEALGTLSGGIAHDFNNILAAIVGFSELALGRAAPGSQEKHHLQRIFEAGLRGRALIKQMLTFSRKTEQDKKPLQLSGIIEETMKLLGPSIPATISIRTDVRGESGLIFADPTQMEQVVMNLCTNAAFAMRERGGVLHVELSDVSVSASDGNPHGIKPGRYTRLTVRDTGAGMSPDITDKIFDPFFTTKQPGEGTGLGLSVVHGIVKQHDGYITVESTPGKGSTFAVYFPMIAGGRETDAAGDHEIPTGSERILFVDDEEPLVELGEEVLAELGYEVTSRMSSGEALELLKADPHRFDLVITDQTMPEMTGVELAREILALRADMPIIMCTGFSHAVDADKAGSAGIRAFAMKPLTKREIARTIRRVLDGHSSR